MEEIARQLAEELLPVVVTILVSVLSVLGTVAVYYLKKWAGITVSDRQRSMFALLALDAVGYTEEQARKALKAKDKTPDSDTKRELAVKYMVNHAREMGLPEMARDRIVEIVESALMDTRSDDDRPPYVEFPDDAKPTTGGDDCSSETNKSIPPCIGGRP